MKLEDQVCSLELSKKLKELGVKQESLFCWVQSQINNKWVIEREELVKLEIFGESATSAFTVAELGEMLPENVCWRDYRKGYGKWGFNWGDFRAEADTEANARAKILIYLLENGLITL